MSETEIEALFAEWKQAVAAGDVETVASLVTADCEFWTNGAPAMRGRDALAATLAAFLARFEYRQEFARQELLVDGALAFVRGVEDNRLQPRDGGAEVRAPQRAFMVLRREADGRWRFARGMTNQLPPEPAP